MKEKVKTLVERAVARLAIDRGLQIPENFRHDLTLPKSKEFGDFTSNISLKAAALFRQKPADLARELTVLLQSELSSLPELAGSVLKIEVEGPGFINFYLKNEQITAALEVIRREDERYGCSDYGKGKKVIVEFVSANPTGPLTIAHGRQACVGDTLARILKASGHQVFAEYYLNDAGRQIDLLGKSTWARYRELLGEAVDFPEEGYQGAYIKDIAREVLDKEGKSRAGEDNIPFFSKYAADRIMEDIHTDLKRIATHFDAYYSELALRKKGEIEKVLKQLTAEDVIYEHEGALWFRSTRYGDDKDRVLKKSSGEYTYLAPDIAYHAGKLERGYEMMVNLWGPDHHGYVPRMKAAVEALGKNPDALQVLLVQLTTLFRDGQPVRMSTRAGEFVTLKELMDEVGTDATRFFFLMRRVESLLDFDLNLAKSQSQDNPVYYLQYAHARICSILKQAPENIAAQKLDLSLLAEEETLHLIKDLAQYPAVLQNAARTLEPYRVTEYLCALAAAFHKFYSLYRVISEDLPLTRARLYLIDCVRIVLRNGLRISGVTHPEKM